MENIDSACRGKPEDIVTRILQEWLQGKGRPLSWSSLITTLRECDLNSLAEKICVEKGTSSTISKSEQEPLPQTDVTTLRRRREQEIVSETHTTAHDSHPCVQVHVSECVRYAVFIFLIVSLLLSIFAFFYLIPIYCLLSLRFIMALL